MLKYIVSRLLTIPIEHSKYQNQRTNNDKPRYIMLIKITTYDLSSNALNKTSSNQLSSLKQLIFCLKLIT